MQFGNAVEVYCNVRNHRLQVGTNEIVNLVLSGRELFSLLNKDEFTHQLIQGHENWSERKAFVDVWGKEITAEIIKQNDRTRVSLHSKGPNQAVKFSTDQELSYDVFIK